MDYWFGWTGGECPVPAGTRLKIMYRDGDIVTGVALKETGLRQENWDFNPGDAYDEGDIVAYRILSPAS